MKSKMKFDTWCIVPNWNKPSQNYKIDLLNENTNDDEIFLCIQAQIYGVD